MKLGKVFKNQLHVLSSQTIIMSCPGILLLLIFCSQTCVLFIMTKMF